MVTKPASRDREELEGGPPLDESWWEAVLSEDEYENRQANARHSPVSVPKKAPLLRAYQEASPIEWDYAQELYEQDIALALKVVGYNRGGLLVSNERLQGFVPVSHLVEMPCNLTEDEQERRLATYLDRSLQLKVIECNQERGRVVFSERAALAKSGSRNLLLSQLSVGECVEGTVTNITDFGVFVDLGGIEGLIHVSEISWGRVRHPSDVVQVGDQVVVHVINVDQERSRVALSLKRLCPNPWETAELRYKPGQVVEAIITSIVPFGAFARLEEGLDGLIHVSEFGPVESGANPSKLLNEGQRVQVRILHVDAPKQRLGLSLVIEPGK